MDWRTIPGFMPQAIPTMQQSPYSTPPHAGGWTTATTHASSIAFQQPTNVSLPSSQSVGYSNGFGGGGGGGGGAQQQFKKSMAVPGVQFGRPLHSAYPQGPMPIVHRKPNLNSSPLLAPPSAHEVANHGGGGAGGGGGDVDSMHSMVPVKSEASDIIEVWESKGRGGFPPNLGGHGPPWLQCPSRVTIKSEPVDIVEGNPWDTAKSVPAFPSNLPAPDSSSWHPVSDVTSVPPPPPLSAPSHYGGGIAYPQDANRVSCSGKKDGPPQQAPGGHPLNLPYGSAPSMGGNVNHGMGPAAGVKPVDSNADMAAGDPNKMKNPNVGGGLSVGVKCGGGGGGAGGDLEGGGAPATGPDAVAPPLPKKKKEKKGPPVPCKQCGKEFSKSYMKKHIRSHAEMKPYVCPTCGKVFYSAPLLAEHESAFHDEEKKHQCYVCGHRFHQKSLLKEHLKTHVEKPYKCRVCPRSFSRRIKLNNHEKLHEGAQLKQCDICGKLLKGRVSLKCHMHNMHSETRKKYPCVDCGRIFLLERSLTTHRYVVHTGERPFKCPDCGRAFADIKYLKSHLLIHTGEKPYQCNVCGKRFRQSTALWCHKTTHTGIKPHRCPDCGRQSVHRSELAKHKCAARRDPQQAIDSPPPQSMSPPVTAPPPNAP